MRIRALILILASGMTAVSPRGVSYTSTEQEAMRVLNKHKALFTLIPQRVAEILKVVRLHSHTDPAQRLDIIYDTIKHVQGKFHIIAQIRDEVKRTRVDMSPYLREGVNQQFKDLAGRLKRYKHTLRTTLQVLDDEVGKLLVAAGGAQPNRQRGRALKAARAVLATNHIDTLVDTLAGRDESAPTESSGLITQMREQIKQLRDQVATITGTVALAARDTTYDFAQKLSAMSDQHAAAITRLDKSHDVLAIEHAERQEREQEARHKAEKEEKKRLKKEKKRLEKEEKRRKEEEEEHRDKAKEERQKHEKEAREKLEKAEKKRHKAEKKLREQEEKALRDKQEREEKERKEREKREQEERDRYEQEERALLLEEKQDEIRREREAREQHERELREQTEREEQALALQEEALDLAHQEALQREEEENARAEREEALLLEREEREARERTERREREERERIERERRDHKKREWQEARDRRKKEEQATMPSRVLSQEVATDVLTGYRWVRDRVSKTIRFVVGVPRKIGNGIKHAFRRAADFWTVQPAQTERKEKTQKQADALIGRVTNGVKSAYGAARDGVVRGMQPAGQAMMSGGILGTQAATPSAWSFAARMRSASSLDPAQAGHQPLLPENVKESYDAAAHASGGAVTRMGEGIARGIRSIGNLFAGSGESGTTRRDRATKARRFVQQHQALKKHGYTQPIVVIQEKVTKAARNTAANMRTGAHTPSRTIAQRGLDAVSHVSARIGQMTVHTAEWVGSLVFAPINYLWNLMGSAAHWVRSGTSSAVHRTHDLSSRGMAALRDTTVHVGTRTQQLAQAGVAAVGAGAAHVADVTAQTGNRIANMTSSGLHKVNEFVIGGAPELEAPMQDDELDLEDDPEEELPVIPHTETLTGVASAATTSQSGAAAPYTFGAAVRAYWNALVSLPAQIGSTVRGWFAGASNSVESTAVGTARAVGAQVHNIGARIKGVGQSGASAMQRGWNAVQSAGKKFGNTVSGGMHKFADTVRSGRMPEVGHSVIDRTKHAAMTGMHAVTDTVDRVKTWFTGKLSQGTAAVGSLKDSVVGGVQNLVHRVRGTTVKQKAARPAYVTRRDARAGMKRMKELVRVRSTKDLYAAAQRDA